MVLSKAQKIAISALLFLLVVVDFRFMILSIAADAVLVLMVYCCYSLWPKKVD